MQKRLKGFYRGKPGESFVSNNAPARLISKDIREAIYSQKPEEGEAKPVIPDDVQASECSRWQDITYSQSK